MDTYHFPANITNCSNNYGPFQFPEKLIPLIINNALHFVGCNGIPAVMPLPVLHIGDKLRGDKRLSGVSLRQHFLQCLQDNIDDLNILLFVVPAHIIGLNGADDKPFPFGALFEHPFG